MQWPCGGWDRCARAREVLETRGPAVRRLKRRRAPAGPLAINPAARGCTEGRIPDIVTVGGPASGGHAVCIDISALPASGRWNKSLLSTPLLATGFPTPAPSLGCNGRRRGDDGSVYARGLQRGAPWTGELRQALPLGRARRSGSANASAVAPAARAEGAGCRDRAAATN